MGVTLTDVLLFGKAQSDDVDNATLVIYRRNILRWSALGGYLDIIVKGVSPISLPDAVAYSLKYLKAFGGTEQRNLPAEYTQLEYIESTGTQYIDTGYKPNDNTSIDIKFSTRSQAHFIFGSRKATSGTDQQSFCLYAGYQDFVPRYGNATYTAANMFRISTAYQVQMNKNGLVIDGITERDFTSENFTGENNLILFGNNTNGTILSAENRIYYSKIYEDGTLVRNFIPAKRNSDNVLGMYDTVSQTFFTNAGTGAFIAGADVTTPSPDMPMDIISNNGVLKVSPNLFDGQFDTGWGIVSSNGSITASANRRSFYIKADSTKTYTISRSAVGDSTYFYYGTYVQQPYDVGQDCVSFGDIGSATLTETITIPEGANYLAFFFGSGESPNVQVELGSTATAYHPYGAIYTDGTVETITDDLGNTATCEMLLSAGNYKDTQEIISGGITHNIGIKVFDGTEDWNVVISTHAGVNRNNFYTNFSDAPGTGTDELICSIASYVQNSLVNYAAPACRISTVKNFNIVPFEDTTTIPTVTAWTQYLADQYAAGTPVIVVYPLATPTTESVTGQTMQVQQGDNFVEITQASLDNLELEAKYKAAVSLTIQEVQDANLDPNVQVTIN